MELEEMQRMEIYLRRKIYRELLEMLDAFGSSSALQKSFGATRQQVDRIAHGQGALRRLELRGKHGGVQAHGDGSHLDDAGAAGSVGESEQRHGLDGSLRVGAEAGDRGVDDRQSRAVGEAPRQGEGRAGVTDSGKGAPALKQVILKGDEVLTPTGRTAKVKSWDSDGRAHICYTDAGKGEAALFPQQLRLVRRG